MTEEQLLEAYQKMIRWNGELNTDKVRYVGHGVFAIEMPDGRVALVCPMKTTEGIQ